MLLHDGEDDNGVFTALAFMYGDGVGQSHVIGFGFFKILGFSVEFSLELAGFRVGGGDKPDVAIEKVFIVVVTELDDFVTWMKGGALAGVGPAGLGVEGGLEDLVKIVYAGDAFVHGCQDLGLGGGVVTAGRKGLGEEAGNEVDALLGIVRLEVVDVLAVRVDAWVGQGDTALEDAVGGCDD